MGNWLISRANIIAFPRKYHALQDKTTHGPSRTRDEYLNWHWRYANGDELHEFQDIYSLPKPLLSREMNK